MRPRFIPAATAAVTLTLLAACGSDVEPPTPRAAAAGFPAVVERCDRATTVDQPPERIVSLNQGSTEMLLSLGVGDRMVGAAGWTDPILPSLAAAGDSVERLADQAPSYETLLSVEPDLVTASFHNSLSEGGVATPEQLSDLGVPAYLSAVECAKSDFSGGDGARDVPLEMADIHTEIRDLGRLVGEPEAAEQVVESLEERMSAAIASAPEIEDVSALYWFANSESPYVAGCCGGPGIITRSLGLTNVFEGQQAEWPQIGWEGVADADPDVIVIGDLTRKSQTAETAQAKIDFLESNPVTREMEAVREDRYIVLTGGDLNPSIRTVDAVEKVARGLVELGLADS